MPCAATLGDGNNGVSTIFNLIELIETYIFHDTKHSDINNAA